MFPLKIWEAAEQNVKEKQVLNFVLLVLFCFA